MVFGSIPIDGGNFLLSASEKDELIKGTAGRARNDGSVQGTAGDPHRHSDKSQNPLNDKEIAGQAMTMCLFLTSLRPELVFMINPQPDGRTVKSLMSVSGGKSLAFRQRL